MRCVLLPFFHSLPPSLSAAFSSRNPHEPPYIRVLLAGASVRVRTHVKDPCTRKGLVQVHGGRAPCSLQKNCTRRKRLGCGKVTQHHESLDRRCQTPIAACIVVLDALAACTRIKWLTTVVPICSLPSPFLSVKPASPLRIAENIFNRSGSLWFCNNNGMI